MVFESYTVYDIILYSSILGARFATVVDVVVSISAVQFPIEFLLRLKVCWRETEKRNNGEEGERGPRRVNILAPKIITGAKVLLFRSTSCTLPSTNNHPSLTRSFARRRYHKSIIATFPFPRPSHAQAHSSHHRSIPPHALIFVSSREFMITASPLECSINNEHKSRSWVKFSIPYTPRTTSSQKLYAVSSRGGDAYDCIHCTLYCVLCTVLWGVIAVSTIGPG